MLAPRSGGRAAVSVSLPASLSTAMAPLKPLGTARESFLKHESDPGLPLLKALPWLPSALQKEAAPQLGL